ncbi:MAG: hypothetical protein M1546_03775 [Chloroflexi bacterium]|nr:hypothetical protein [Chloroflexota bacterium]
MAKTKAELKAALMAELEQEIDRLLEWESQTPIVTLTDIETRVLAQRLRLSERIATELTQARADRLETAFQTQATRGARPRDKGKKLGQ